MRLFFFPIVLFFVFLSAAFATHEMDHRYNVKGFVLDANADPISNSAVSIRLGNQVIGYQKTNSQGYYDIRLHLHDRDLGRNLQIRTAAAEASIRVTFTPGDKSTRRIHYANVIGGKLVEQRLTRNAFPLWGYAAIASAAVALAAAMMIGKRIRRKRKREQAKARRDKRKRR
jgi:hypothetical protein